MPSFTAHSSRAYAPDVALPSLGPGPWGEAIRHWLTKRGMSLADLSRKTGIGANPIGRMARGHHTQTRKLQLVAETLNVPLEDVLVSPDRRQKREEQKRLIQEAVEAAMSSMASSVWSADTPASVDAVTRASEEVIEKLANLKAQQAPKKRKKRTTKKPKRSNGR